MCGRFTLRASAKDFVEAFGCLPVEESPRPLFNVAPSQLVTVVRQNDNQPGGERHSREAARLRWGLIPAWADDPAIGSRMINARAETVATKPAFRHSFRQRRCLVAADGFYEWRRDGRRKQPFYITLSEQRPFAFAGLWDHWQRGDERIESCAIVTTSANELVGKIHDRMPVILAVEDYDTWLNPTAADVDLLRPYPALAMTAYPVSPLVNDPKNDVRECLAPDAETKPKERQLWLE